MFPNISIYAIPGIPSQDTESRLIEDVVKTFGISIYDFKSKNRQAPLPMARAVACFVYYRSYNSKVNVTNMAKLFFVDRSVIYHYIKMINNVLDVKDKNYYSIVKSLLDKYDPDYKHERS